MDQLHNARKARTLSQTSPFTFSQPCFSHSPAHPLYSTPKDKSIGAFALGASPGAFLAVEAARGFGFGTNLTGPLLTTPTNKGTHGYNPAIREMHLSFILYGAGITPCEFLPDDVKIFDVGSTAAALLGVSMKGTQGTAVDHIQAGSPKQ